MESPLQKVYGGMILGSKKFITEALERVEFERIKNAGKPPIEKQTLLTLEWKRLSRRAACILVSDGKR